jgi:thiol:disulfide interchange protein
MTAESSRPVQLRNLMIALAVILLSIGLLIGNSIRTSSVNLSTLAESGVPLEVARSNHKPTLLEFYADWCTTCKMMAPMLADLKENFSDQINFVMLNVDNPKWLPELTQFRVNGIPHFVFLDSEGNPLMNAIGEQPRPVMETNLQALAQQSPLTTSSQGEASQLHPLTPQQQPDPRSHA